MTISEIASKFSNNTKVGQVLNLSRNISGQSQLDVMNMLDV